MKNLLKLLKDNAKLNVVAGITLTLIGIIAISLPFLSGLTVAGVVSLAMVAYGLTVSIFSFSKEKIWHKIFSFIAGILITMLGGLMLINPVANLYTLAIITVCYFIIDGVINLISSYEIRKSNIWGWSLFNGIVSLVLAGLLVSQWPLASFYIVGTLVGVRFIFTGFNIVLLASTGFGVVDSIEASEKENNNVIEGSSTTKVQHA